MLHIDLQKGLVIQGEGEMAVEHDIGTPEAFELLSEAWLRSGWDTKYVYSFTWLGRPIIQLPEDMLRLQEVIFELHPDVIVETGVAHGGSLVFYASLCKAMGMGRVIGVDVQIRPQNREAIERHFLSSLITLVEGDSVAPATVKTVKGMILPSETVLVLLDSCHTKAHVLAELEAYAPLVSPKSYAVAMDGIMGQLVGAPRTRSDWSWNNPRVAAEEFVRMHPAFSLVEPKFVFNEGSITKRVTYWPGAFVQRR
ncbi:MAG: class I SAM-dependent methyltransferase [Verrucomicrobia bacterium]|nr:class I SAM-dependent methyltransferase [Verrucomicrobiota bacterium]